MAQGGPAGGRASRRDLGGIAAPTGRWIVATPVLQFALAGIVALSVVAVGTLIASRRVGEREAIVDARTAALVKGQGLVEPTLSDLLLAGDPAARARVARVVERDVLDADLVRVKLWAPSGRILYSDEPRLVGQQFTLGGDELRALADGQVVAQASDLALPENRYERPNRKLLEVYLPLATPNGQRVLFEAYFRYDAVRSSGSRIWRSFAPISLGSLVLLEIVQIPLAWSLARRLRRQQRERERLLRLAIDASDLERRRIAHDLHDGVVQDLAGVSYALAGYARQGGAPPAVDLEASAAAVRASIESLRTLLVEIYPPDLAEEGLAAAVADLLARARAVGLETHLNSAALIEPVPVEVASLLYRTVQEALRNVMTHAGARSVTVEVATDDATAWARVADDGRGFDPQPPGAQVADGHFGLTGLAGLAADAGGRLVVTSSRGHGAVIRMEVPLR
ncbi:MAG: Histidine kinase, gyrase and HSP90-like ATPase [Acidimicrobiales bacterium]|nr:Histidine kinase, gyrase and HSP90-like ATPase [Acidimicrobiales bacterium]